MFENCNVEMQMIDTHMHLIPGVDDGAEDMMMALVMMSCAKEQGISQIIATPHSEAFHYSREGAKPIFQRLCNTAARMCPDMKIYLGCEVYCEAEIMGEVLKDLDSGRYPTMNGTKYVLMEFSMWVQPEGALSCVEAMVEGGYHPIIAHLERYRYLRDDMELVNRFREMGVLIQLNAYSLSGESNDSVKNWARRLVQERKADFLGTDAHRTYHRPPSARMGLAWLYENVDREYTDSIVWKNAKRILLDAE